MSRRHPFFLAAALSFPLALLLAIASLGGLLLPDTYARESATWAAQGMGQDGVNLLVVVPLLVVCAWFTLRGSRLFALPLGGALIYTLYSMVLYAFAVHFNALFPAYCGALGLSFYALLSLVSALRAQDVRSWFSADAPAFVTGVFSAVLGAGFYALWLMEVIPALLNRTVPKSALDAGLITNPVHVLDLGIVLPAFIVGGVSLMHRRPLGYYLAPMLVAFGVIMDIALVGMVLSMSKRSVPAEGPPLAVLGVATIVGILVLWRFLRAGAPARALDGERH